MLPPVKGLGLWILPDTDSEKKYLELIIKCADLFESEPFLPHITLSKVPELSLQELEERIVQVAENISPFDLKINEITCRDEPYQKICMECAPNPEFYLLTDAIDRALGGSFSKRMDPHLSLLYSRAECKELDTILKELKQQESIFEPLRCGRIGLVQFSGTPSTWEILFEVSLEIV